MAKVLSNKQWAWLNQMGGRDEDDVLVDKQGLYIVMNDADGEPERIYLPADDKLLEERVSSSGHAVFRELN